VLEFQSIRRSAGDMKLSAVDGAMVHGAEAERVRVSVAGSPAQRRAGQEQQGAVIVELLRCFR
jgi:hypothetical protein